MVDHPNFYENIAEAQARLHNTVVCYDGEPYSIIAIADTGHKDGIFRAYLWALNAPYGPPAVDGFGGGPDVAKYIDTLMKKEDYAPHLLRKHLNSPAFNKFRPFPLGMMNKDGTVYYLERQPTRHREQGLTRHSVTCDPVTLTQAAGLGGNGMPFALTGAPFRDCIVGAHPSFEECIKNMRDPAVQNQAVAFHRYFALIRGPLNTLFLSHKAKTIGVVEDTRVRLGAEFKHLKETVEELKCFTYVTI